MRRSKFQTWVARAALLYAAGMSAWVSAADEPEAQACLRVDYPQAALPTFAQAVPAPYSSQETGCWTDTSEARRSQGMVLDVRDASLAARSPLQGTVALPLESIADRPYLRDQHLVLVGNGVDLRALTRHCLALQEQGFSRVRVLLGGVRSWSRTQRVDMLTAQEAWQGGADGQWRVISVGLGPDQIAALPVAPAVTLEASIDAAGIQKALAVAEGKRPLAPQEQWLVVSQDAEAQRALLPRWQQTINQTSTETRPVAWLEGGWTAYRSYLEQQKNSAAYAGRALPRACGA